MKVICSALLSFLCISSVDGFLFQQKILSSQRTDYCKNRSRLNGLVTPVSLPVEKMLFAEISSKGVQGEGAKSSIENKVWALIFDCDGVILESEGLHRDAYNQMFDEFSINYNWSPEYYDELQNLIGGGIPKMRYYFNLHGWPTKISHESLQIEEEYTFNQENVDDPDDTLEKEKLLNILQDRKTIIYKSYVSDGVAEVRPGFKRLVSEALKMENMGSKPKLAICSASTKTSCLFVLDNLLGDEILKDFDLILAGDDVKKRKPDAEIYNLACEKLGVKADQCIVVEDSLIGLQAAVDAKMKCIITHTPSTATQDFIGNGAVAVYPELGDEKIYVTAETLANFVFN